MPFWVGKLIFFIQIYFLPDAICLLPSNLLTKIGCTHYLGCFRTLRGKVQTNIRQSLQAKIGLLIITVPTDPYANLSQHLTISKTWVSTAHSALKQPLYDFNTSKPRRVSYTVVFDLTIEGPFYTERVRVSHHKLPVFGWMMSRPLGVNGP